MIGSIIRTVKAKTGGIHDYVFVKSKGKDYFLHRTAFSDSWNDMMNELARGKKVDVEFDIEDSPKGPRVSKCQLLPIPK